MHDKDTSRYLESNRNHIKKFENSRYLESNTNHIKKFEKHKSKMTSNGQ